MSKRLIVLFVGLVLIAVLICVGVLVFRVDKISVDFDTETAVGINEGEMDAIIEASGVKTGKSIFSLNESSMVKNIENAMPEVDVLGIERRFPNKVVIHVSKRVPVYAISYRLTEGNKDNSYILVDGDMVVIKFVDSIPVGDYITLSGFELIGRHDISLGKTLSVEFGDEIFYLQNIAASFYNAGLTPVAYRAFIDDISFESDIIDIKTNSGVILRIGSKLTTAEVAERVPKAYEWYCEQMEGSQSLLSGIANYNEDLYKFVWNNV